MIKKMMMLAVSVFLAVISVSANELSMDWEAQWIWQDQNALSNSWVAFRKEIKIAEVPEKVVANISADSKYWMWINGELAVFEGSVARGPSPAKTWKRVKEMWKLPPEEKPSNSWYEEVDLTPYLKTGENTIAVLAWYWGNETHKGTHIDSGKGGFIFQADFNGKKLISDRSWKVKADPAYALDSGDTGDMVLQFNVKYDARKEMGEWTKPGYSDADWASATELGIPPVAPWYKLEKNYVPALKNHGLQNYENYPESKFPFVSTGEAISCTLPFNKQITPYLEVECDEGLQINVTTDNTLNKINAFYTTKKGKQDFEGFAWMNGHQVIYEIPKGVKVLGLKYRWMSVGDINAGTFTCSDPFYNRIWWMGRNTLFVCARDNFMDCPDRERGLWIGDVADQASYLFYCMDESGRQLLKKAIRITMDYSHDDIYAALGPLRLRELPSQSMQFVEQGVWQYYLNTGDKETLRHAYPYVRDYLTKAWRVQDNGLIKRQKRWNDYWNWFDWGDTTTIDGNVILNAMYYMALNSAKDMAQELGITEDIAELDQRIETVNKGFNKKFWNGEYYTSKPGQLKDDRGNALAILSGLASPDKFDSIVENVLIPVQSCSPHFEWMVEDAMCRAGYHEAALKRMKDRYQEQVDIEWLSTLYERVIPKLKGSYNHAWNAPNTILAKHIAGIHPTKPGWTEYQILPNLEHFTSIEQVVPSVQGDIKVELKNEKNKFGLKLTSPKGTTAVVGIPKSPVNPTVIEINGSVVCKNGKFIPGMKGISWIGEDKKYIKLSVFPGVWTFNSY